MTDQETIGNLISINQQLLIIFQEQQNKWNDVVDRVESLRMEFCHRIQPIELLLREQNEQQFRQIIETPQTK